MLGGLSIKNNFFLIGYGQPLLREKLWRKDFLNLFNFEYYILGLMADYYLFTYFLKLFFDDSFPSRYFYENQKRKLAKFLCDDTYGPMIYIRHIYFMDLAMYGCKIRYINMVRIEFTSMQRSQLVLVDSRPYWKICFKISLQSRENKSQENIKNKRTVISSISLQ